MINLLPPDIKTSYRFARSNVTLRKWIVIFVIALIGLGILGTYGLLSIQQSINLNRQEISDTEETFKKEDYALTQKRVEEISGSFKLVVNVLGQEVLFSQLIKRMGAAIPANANLTGLNIVQTQGGLDITANAVDYKTATQVQVNLADSENQIFSKADIVSITCDDATDTTDPTKVNKYPCTVNIRALFSNNNPFLFINSKTVKP